MRKPIQALVLLLAAVMNLAHGQSVETPPEGTTKETVGTVVIEEPSEGPSFFGKRRVVAENAEAAEELAAERRLPRIWVRNEFLLWFIKSARFPALVTTGSFTELRPGSLDSADTQVLYGRGGMDYQDRLGGRFTVGYWLDSEQIWGIQANYFFVRGRALGQDFSSPGSPVLARPFFNTAEGLQDSSLITFPGIASGAVVIDAPSFLQGAETNLNVALWIGEHARWDALLGVRYLNLSESLNIHGTTLIEVAPQYQGFGIPFDGNTIDVRDSFQTRNHFYGGQAGGRLEFHRGRFGVEFVGKVALGVSHRIVNIQGSTEINTQPAVNQDAGLYAVASNRGRHSSNAFAVVPEVGATLTFQLTERITLFGGYSILYWSNVLRPGDQIDQAVNPNLIPTSATFGAAGGALRPEFPTRATDFYAHGAHFGFEFRY